MAVSEGEAHNTSRKEQGRARLGDSSEQHWAEFQAAEVSENAPGVLKSTGKTTIRSEVRPNC